MQYGDLTAIIPARWIVPEPPAADLLSRFGRRWVLTIHGAEVHTSKSDSRFWRQAAAEAARDSLNRARAHFGQSPDWAVTDPVITMAAPWAMNDTELLPPSRGYRDLITEGLMETWRFTRAAATAYLDALPGSKNLTLEGSS